MSTTKMFSGIGDGSRTSSKVLRPPGGGSSNIFGDEPAAPVMTNGSTTPNGKHEMSPTKTSPRKSPDGSQDRLFGTPETTDGPRRKSVDRMKSSIFNAEQSTNDELKSSRNGNPLTGENGDATEQKATSVKMHNPPGGRSQVQFF